MQKLIIFKMCREKPRDTDWNELNVMKIPYVLNIAQCKLCLKDYYGAIEQCNIVLEIDPGEYSQFKK